jgi:MFS superfamily sulfate permease-like transporter
MAEDVRSGSGVSPWRDLVSGLCVAGLLLPEAVAYAGLAHLPVGHALSASLVGLAIYALFGGSRFAIVAPTSSTATLAGAAALSLTGAGPGGSAAYTQAFLAVVLLSGLMLMLLASARQGQLSSFISRPVLRGFAFALAVTIVIKQLPDALGLALPPEMGAGPGSVLAFVIRERAQWHGPSVAVALSAALLMAVLRPWPQVPAAMGVIVLAIAAAQGFDLQALGVREIGAVAPLAWRFGWPQLPFQEWMRVGELAFGLVMLVFAESWASMRSTALPHGDALNANRELMVLGACNVGSALLQGMAVGAGFSATSANAAAGAVSRKSGLVALLVIGAAVSFALPLLQLLPRPVLAVAVIGALWHALSPQPLINVWRMNRDRLLVLGAAFAVLLLGVLYGMLAAIGLSVLAALRRFSQPVVHELGALGASRNFVDVNTQPAALAVEKLLILRPEEPLFFGSAEQVMAEVLVRANARTGLDDVLLSLEESADLDSTAVECLMELDHALARSGKRLLLVRVKTTVRELLGRWDPEQLGRSDRLFWSVADGVDFALGRTPLPGQPSP